MGLALAADLGQDVRFAARLLIKDHWFTVTAVLTLAIGMGANAAVFMGVNAVLVHDLPMPEPDRVMALWSENDRARRVRTSGPYYEDWLAQTRSFSVLAAFYGDEAVNVGGNERATERLTEFRFLASGTSVGALLALLFSAVGLYAVTAYSASQRTREIGLRVALGARPGQVQWLVLRRALWQLAIGLSLGIAAALSVGQLLGSQLFGTGALEPTTLISIVAILTSVALLACVVPARRAARLDPMVALRSE